MQRIVAAVVAIVFGPIALWVVIRTLFAPPYNPLSVVFGVWASLIETAAILCGWFALRGDRPASRVHIRLTMRGGFIVGGIAFVAGFVGPLIFQPKANQGPLIGIFFTGPLGFVVGAVIGWFYGWVRHEDSTKSA